MENRFTEQEEQLRALGERFSLNIDTSEFWDKVEAQLPPVEENRRPVAWWFAGGALVVIAGMLIWYAVSNNGQQDHTENQIAKSINPSEIEKTTNTYTKHNEKSPEIVNSVESAQTPETSFEDKTNAAFSNQQSYAKTEKYNNRSILYANRYDEKSPNRKEDLINQGSADRKSKGSLINPSSEEETESIIEILNQNREFISLTSINTKTFSPLENEVEFDLPLMEIEPLKKTSWLPYLAMYSGVNTHRSDIFTNSPEGLDLTQFDNEKPLLGLNSDLQFGMESINGWRIGIGLNYSRLTSRHSQIQPDTVVSTITGNTTSKIDSDGNYSNTSGELQLTTVTNYNVNWHRIHNLVNLQLSVGKRIIRKGNISAFSNVSFNKNIWSNHTGYYYSEGSETINKFTSNEDNPYTNAGNSLGISIDLEYKINDFAISLRPFTLIGLNNITQNSNYYQLKNSQYGVQLGVVYKP